jgi:polar amino acid transport system substrate-binding protein
LVGRDETRLVQALNDAILACYRDGSFPAVLKKYSLWNRTQQLRGLTTDADGNFQGASTTVDQAAEPGGEASPEPASNSLSMTLRRLPILLQGAVITVLLAVLSMPLAIAVGLAIAIGRLYGPRWLGRPLAWYVEVIRGTPLVLQLYLIFFLLPELGVSLPALLAAVMGLAINYSAYEAEIYRAGLLAIPKGQMEAALSLGMTRSMALRRIIVPQAVRIVVPPVTNDFIALFKDTAVCSVITVVELSKLYYIHARSTGAVVELGLVTAGLYLAMSYPLSVFVSSMERRLAPESR